MTPPISNDGAIERSKWIEIDKSQVLSQRASTSSIGSVLIHPLLGWSDPSTVNTRYKDLFNHELVPAAGVDTLERLWILRHSVAHNAGQVTGHDSYRLKAPSLSEKQLRIDPEFLEATIWFLADFVRRMEDPIGVGIIRRWLTNKATGDWEQDREVYSALKLAVHVQESRTKPLPDIAEADYAKDKQLIP